MTRFKDLPNGAHYRIPSQMREGVILPSVRVKVGDNYYRMLYPSHSVKRLAASEAAVVPVLDSERV